MRRGRIILLVLLFIAIIIIAVILFFRFKGGGFGTSSAISTPAIHSVEVVTAGQNISTGKQITLDMLETIKIPEEYLVKGEFTTKAEVSGQFAKIQIPQGVPIMDSMISLTPGNVNLNGSSWAPMIPQGLTAIAIPISRLSSSAYGIRDGDFVDVIVTMLLVDVDANYQSILPNVTAGILAPNGRSILLGGGNAQTPSGTVISSDQLLNLTAQSVSGLLLSPQGRIEYDASLQAPFYIVPDEAQRPRLVSQMIMQNVQALHVGTFPLPGEEVTGQIVEPTPTTTPNPANQGQQVASQVQHPDIITLMVTNQDAVTLTYLIYSGAQITLALRNPNDTENQTTTEAATLQYLLSQYNIPVPAKLPYSLQPRLDQLLQPTLPNDTILVPAK